MDNSYTNMDDPAVTAKFRINDSNAKKVFLLSGKHAYASRRYFKELKTQLTIQGFEVTILDHPNPSAPTAEESIAFFSQFEFNDSIVITHSLGGASILMLLNQEEITLDKLIMIAPPAGELPSTNPDWLKDSGYNHYDEKLDFEKIKPLVSDVTIIHSDDPIIETKYFELLESKLGAKRIVEENKGHYFEKDADMSPDSLIDTLELDSYSLQPPTYMLAWTTTPWTLPSNRALVVDANGDYLKVQRTVEIKEKTGATAIIYNPKKKQFLALSWPQDEVLGIHALVQGKQEDGETLEETVLREITEETGYTDLKLVKKLGTNNYQWPSKSGNINDRAYDVFLVELENEKQQKRQLEEGEDFDVVWIDEDKFLNSMTYRPHRAYAQKVLDYYNNNDSDELVNSFEPVISSKTYHEYLILGKERAEEVLENFSYEIVEEFKGEKLLGLTYQPLFNFIPGNENDFKVYEYEGMVTADEGVGIVHSAPGFGEIDSEMGKANNLTMMLTVDDEGKFRSSIRDYAGIYYKDANKHIVIDLVQQNQLLKIEKITHRYPFCYRCETPLIQKAQPSWFIDVQKIKKNLIANNEEINWVPDHIKEGRFKKGLETAPDWGISRSRYWGTPMPVWHAKNDEGEVIEEIVIGSRDELMARNDAITKIIFVRHGDIGSGKDADVSLTERGKNQAQNIIKLLNDLKPDAILSSSMQRCIETITPYAQSVGVEITPDDRFGSSQRKEDLYARKDEFGVKSLKHEPEDVVQKIIEPFVNQDRQTIQDLYNSYKGKTLVICTHAEVLASLRHILEGDKYTTYLKGSIEWGEVFPLYLYEGKLLDLHRPVIDNIVLKGDSVPELHRVSETLDVWMESASMPYAQKHYPFENKADFEANFPADYITEYIAQTRAWFYVMHVISTAMLDKPSFKNVVVSGVIMGNDGRKMSKSYGNYPDPKGVIQQYGGDALRMYMLSTPLLKGENVDIDENAIKGQLREFILPLWNSYSFFLTYVDIHNWTPPEDIRTIPENTDNTLDIWIISKLHALTAEITDKLDRYDIPGATNALPTFLIELSKWYIRRSRDRFRDGDTNALATLYFVLIEYIKLISPFAPFVADGIYQNLVDTSKNPISIHLCDYPEVDEELLEKHAELLTQMDAVRTISSLGQSLRVENGLKVRQPLATAEVYFGDGVKATPWMNEIIQEELNVKNVITKDEQTSADGFVSTQDHSSHAKITLDSNISPELAREGLLRETIRNIQAFRKRSGFAFGDEISLTVQIHDDSLRELFTNNEEELKLGVNAKSITIVDSLEGKELKINGMKLTIDAE
ncbi:class I tRNA ligase family protein [Candidatus Dojkabacteria bacterium]|uniref:Class I tRNA ligase family protein n=1 Tax=Candidatus Dojkabacteria bacterium TaxID=2099670 RepID=A0A955L9A1_9BACT|nr:class I tRNA ligase family protein [Candidatus Dojkabacteria bacterium]